jgi:hypothetical protein
MRRIVVAALLVGSLFAAFYAISASAGQGPFAVKNCKKPQARPETIVIACADFGIFVDTIDWDRWGNRKARGEGVLSVNTCNPSCAQGTFKHYPVDIRLRQVRQRRCGGGKPVPLFRTMLLSFPSTAPSSADELSKSKLSCG